MNVLSLFDGISCSMVALKRAGIEVKTYYASEIDKHAKEVSKKNHPEIIQLGDVREVKPIPDLFLLIGGSPCQDLSIAKKGRQGLEGERSGLFYEYVRIMKESKPKYFILENVNSMSKESKAKITEVMGVEPIMINASLVSAQSRKRLFWTNIPIQGLPEDKGILLKDILEPNIEGKEITKFTKSKEKFTPITRKLGYIGDKDHQSTRVYDIEGKAPALNVVCNNGMIRVKELEQSTGQAHRVYSTEGKSATLSNGGAGLIKIGSSAEHSIEKKNRTMIYVPSGKSTEIIRTGTEVRRKLKNGVRADSDINIIPIRRIEVRNDDKCGTLTTVLKDNQVVNLETKKVRKLTPIECERLQGLPDNYTEGISNTQRYKCLGNAFNVDVIVHILEAIQSL